MSQLSSSLIIEEQDEELKSKRAVIKKKTTSCWASSRGRIALVWFLAIAAIITIYALIPHDNERWLEAMFLATTLTGSFASTMTVLIWYASPDQFHCSAYLVHGMTFMFSFSMLGLLGTDFAFTLRNRQNGDCANQLKFNSFMDVLWQVIYWGNFIQGSIVNKFFQKYWLSGHFSTGSRVRATLKLMLKMIIFALLFFAIIAGVYYYFTRDDAEMHQKVLTIGQTTMITMSNVYGTLVLVILLSYGLAFLPFSAWKRSNNSQLVYEKLMTADQVFQESKDARIEFMKEAKMCRNFAREHADETNKEFMEALQAEIPTEDLDGQIIYDSDIFKVKIKDGQKVDENLIATRRFQLKHKQFIYRRKRATWLSLYRGVGARVHRPIQFEQAYLSRKLKIDTDFDVAESNEQIVRGVELAIKIKEKPCCWRGLIRTGAILSVIWSIFLLWNESMLIAGNSGSVIRAVDQNARDRVWVIFISTILLISAIVFSAFLTIFKLRFSDYLQLVPKLTDPLTFCSFTSLFSKVIAVTCFNFMVMAGEVQLRIDNGSPTCSENDVESSYQTSFIKFYSSMIRTPFLGTQYNYLLPGAILAFSMIFLLLSCLKYESKLVAMLKRYNNHQDNIQSSESSDHDANTLDSVQKAVQGEVSENQSNQLQRQKRDKKKPLNRQACTEIEKLYKGEIAFLKEVKAQRDRVQKARRKAGLQNVGALIQSKRRNGARFDIGALGGGLESIGRNDCRNPLVRQSIEGSFEQRPEDSSKWRNESLNRLKALNFDDDDCFDEDKDVVDPFMQDGDFSSHYSMENDSSDDSEEGIKEEKKRAPVYNQAGIDISEFMNEDFHKPVPLYTQATTKQKFRETEGNFFSKQSERRDEKLLQLGFKSKERGMFSSNVLPKTSNKLQKQTTYDNLVRSGTIKVPTRQSLLEEKQGYLEKKSTKSRFGISVWNKRYCILQKGKLLMFKSEQDYLKSLNQCYARAVPRKVIDMSHVTSVNFHYDPDAPVKSKKLLRGKNLDDSRFDVYTPTRTYMLRSENNNMEDSASWVASLKEAVEFFS